MKDLFETLAKATNPNNGLVKDIDSLCSIIELKVIKKTQTKIILENKNGDTFVFDPNSTKGESLFDFLFY